MTTLRLLLALMIMSVLPAHLHAEDTTIGYCNGEYTKTGTFSVEGNADVSGAIYLPPSFLDHYAGARIVALRAALASKVNIDRLDLWVRADLDQPDLAATQVTSQTEPALTKGWMETPLDQPLEIQQGQGLYIGMTYHQKAAAKAFSLVGNGFDNSFIFLDNATGQWQQMGQEGILSIEAVVSGDMGVDYDLALISAVADITSDPAGIPVAVRVANNGSMPVDGFSLAVMYEDINLEPYRYEFDCHIGPGQKETVTCNVPRLYDIMANPLLVTLEAIAGAEDAIADNNCVPVSVPAVKKVFVEEYTTEPCSNCPRVARYLHEVMEEEAYAGRVVAVCHHAGYGTDPFTQPCDEDMTRMFNINGAPYVSYDRFPYFNDGRITHTPDKAGLRTYFDRRLTEDPGVKISITPSLDDLTLNVSVGLERTTIAVDNPCLTVYVTEDNVKPYYQKGNEDKTHIHRHVIRAYNSTWGDPIVWNGTRAAQDYTFTLDPAWKTADLNVVAVVANHNATDSKDNVVVNSEEVHIGGLDAIGSVTGDATVVTTECFDIAGRRADPSQAGFKILRHTLSDGTVRSEKVMLLR